MMQAHMVLLAVQKETMMSTRMRMARTRSSGTTASQRDVGFENMHLVSKRHHHLMHNPSLQMPELETATTKRRPACFESGQTPASRLLESEQSTTPPTTLTAYAAGIAYEDAVP